jgi:hypothetical protein
MWLSGDEIYIPTCCMCVVRFGGEVDDEAGRASMGAVCIGDQGSTAPLFDLKVRYPVTPVSRLSHANRHV